MMRIVALLIFGSVLAACSGSSRIEDIVSSRAEAAIPLCGILIEKDVRVERRAHATS
jgi:hypothetical protein